MAITDSCTGKYSTTGTGSIADFFKSFSSTGNTTNGALSGNDGLCNMVYFLNFVRDIALDLGGIVAVIMIMYSAYLYLNTNGDETKAETAKKTLLWSIGGMAVIILAKVIIAIVRIEFDH